jgi:hypothetical protein
MQLCCEDVKAKLRNYMTVSTDAKQWSGANKMSYKDAPPQTICARKMRSSSYAMYS